MGSAKMSGFRWTRGAAMPTGVWSARGLESCHVLGECLGERRGEGADAHPGRDMPLLLAVVKSHDLGRTDARLALAGAHCEAEALGDDGAEVGQLFNVPDGQRRRDVRQGGLEFGSQFREDLGVGKEVDGHDLGLKVNFIIRLMGPPCTTRMTYT